MKPAWVLTGDGINCEQETAQALRAVGFETRIRHLNDVIAERVSTGELGRQTSLIALPGGFSFGDDLGSGKVLALKISHGLGWDLGAYARGGGLVLGVCNGFQALIKLGVFGRDVTITHNAGGAFINRWESLQVQGSHCLWLQGLERFDWPIRHGEGRLIFAPEASPASIAERTCLTYVGDPNGSQAQVAGLTDPTGRILGLMPHPEAAFRVTAHPDWTAREGLDESTAGMRLFENAARAAGGLK